MLYLKKNEFRVGVLGIRTLLLAILGLDLELGRGSDNFLCFV